MRPDCPHCQQKNKASDGRKMVIRDGSFWRKSDGRSITKFKCCACGRHFSNATFAPEYRQKKRHKNLAVKELFVEGNAMRGISRLQRLHRETVKRKLIFLSQQAEIELARMNGLLTPVTEFQFDDLETAEGSKYAPLAVSTAVLPKRWILGSEVSSMPSKMGLKGAKLLKYGGRKDERSTGRQNLFTRISPFCRPDVKINSDMHPHYPKSIREHFPLATHIQHRSRKPQAHGQDELKKGFDPLFALNHTFAMQRDRIARLTRKSWCLSKKAENLQRHLVIYAVEHNKALPIWKEICTRLHTK